MKQIVPYGVAIFSIVFLAGACTKREDSYSERTIANIAGTYQLTGFTKTINDITYNAFDTMSECQKNNLVQFNTDMTVDYIDAGNTCSFPANRRGTWWLEGGILYLNGNVLRIKNFNGKTLALTAITADDPGVINFITWVKK